MRSAGAIEKRNEAGPLARQRAFLAPQILLVVDDDLLGRDLADSLESLGYAVDDILTSALAPLEEGFRLRSDVVLVDLELRGQIAPLEAGRLIDARWHRPIVYLVDDVQQADRVTQLAPGRLM